MGAAYSPAKSRWTNSTSTAALFADQGGFDIPENYNLGIAFKATPKMTIAPITSASTTAGSTRSAIPATNFGPQIGSTLGVARGAVSAGRTSTCIKLGVEYAISQNLMLRGGFNHGDNPIQSRDVTFNIIAPGVVQDHLTLGLTYKTKTGGELTFAYMHAFEESVTGPSLFNTWVPGTGSETIKMHQDSFGIAYGWKM